MALTCGAPQGIAEHSPFRHGLAFDPAIQCQSKSNAIPDFTTAWMAGSRLCVRLRRGKPGPAMTNGGPVDTTRSALRYEPLVERIEYCVPVIAVRTPHHTVI